MTICNMSIEAGARAGMVAPDDTTVEYIKGRPHAPEGAEWDAAVEHWRTLRTDEGAEFDAEVVIDADALEPFRGRHIVSGGVSYCGPAELTLGLAALAQGRLDTAVADLDTAVRMADRSGASACETPELWIGPGS